MNPLVDVTVSLYFKIKNSEMYGGEGSIGYVKVSYYESKTPENVDEEFINTQIEIIMMDLRVGKEDIRLISKEEYESEKKFSTIKKGYDLQRNSQRDLSDAGAIDHTNFFTRNKKE